MTTPRTDTAHESDSAAQLRGFGPVGLLAMAVILLGSLAGPIVGALLVIAWARMSQTPLRALGFSAPRSWTTTVVGGVAAGIALKLVMKALVMPLLGAPPINAAYQYLAGNAAALPGIVATVLTSAAVGEEVLYRGYLFERLGALLGRKRPALVVTVVLPAALFAAAHYVDQGLPGVAQSAVTGLVFGWLFAWRRQIVLVMIVHAAFDLTAVALIYWQWEASMAHSLFR